MSKNALFYAMCAKKYALLLRASKVFTNFAQNSGLCAKHTFCAYIEIFIFASLELKLFIMVLKTRDRLIEVARQLFARKGIENTTMNDIASASDKGRRTIYTYFKNKRDIFNAVVEQETETLVKRLSEIENKDISAPLKIEEYMVCRFETMREIVSRNGSLKAGFFRDVRKVDRARKAISEAEIQILTRILKQGVEDGAFADCNPEQTATVMVHCIHGLDVPYIRDNLAEHGLEQNTVMRNVIDIILNGIRRRLPCDMPIIPDSPLANL